MKTLLAVTLVLGLLHHDHIDTVKLPAGAIAEQGIGEGTLARSPLLVVGDRVIYVDGIEHEPWAVSLPLSLQGAARKIGDADVVIPSATPGRLWLGTRRSRTPQPSLRSLREVALDGRTTLAVRHETPGERLVGALREGLVFARDHALTVWNPRTGRSTRTFAGRHLVAAQGSRLALCRGRCFRILLLRGRDRHVVRAPRGTYFLRVPGAFSRDGALLAVSVEPRRNPRIALVDAVRGTSTLVPGARLGRHAALAWSPTERRLFFAGARGRIFTYTRGGSAPSPTSPASSPPAQTAPASRRRWGGRPKVVEK
jgi:hypothetical protein